MLLAAVAFFLSWLQDPGLTIDLSSGIAQMWSGAQTMIDALSPVYLLIAGFGLGVAILAAIMKAVGRLRL
jgi:hypothetical protein